MANVGGGRGFLDVELLGDAFGGVSELGGGFGDQALSTQYGLGVTWPKRHDRMRGSVADNARTTLLARQLVRYGAGPRSQIRVELSYSYRGRRRPGDHSTDRLLSSGDLNCVRRDISADEPVDDLLNL